MKLTKLIALLPLIMALDVHAAPGITISAAGLGENGDDVVPALQVLGLLTVLSLVPAILVILTSFTRIIIVLSMLRHAFGMQETPPNTVLIGLALFLTLFTMTPVISVVESEALNPFLNDEITSTEALDRAAVPIKAFMVEQTREKDLALVIDLAGGEKPRSIDEVGFSTLVPAFMLSELQTAFQIGFVIFLPFLLVDLLVASVLMSMGMIMVPPLTISLPIKVVMFVLIEGWALVTQALVGSF